MRRRAEGATPRSGGSLPSRQQWNDAPADIRLRPPETFRGTLGRPPYIEGCRVRAGAAGIFVRSEQVVRPAATLALTLLLACAAGAPPDRAPFPEPRGDELSRVERLGLEIFQRDRAAWRATDAVADAMPPPSGARGWITVRKPPGWLVRFIGECEGRPCALVDVEVGTSPTREARVVSRDASAPLSEAELSAWRARQLAVGSGFRRCTPKFNTVVIPDTRGREPVWLVYLLAASESPRVVLAGHHRVVVSADGRTLLSEEPLSRGCLVSEPDPRAVGMFVTHVLDPEPIETHVFTSLSHRMPLYVGTERGTFSVTGAEVELVEPR